MSLNDWLHLWNSPSHLWLMATAALTAIACGLPGTYLVLRRMSLTGDALSHSVLPGLVIGFVIAGSLDSPLLIAGAAASGWLTVMMIEWMHRKGGVREDAATGVAFTTMFSLGVLLLRIFATRVDLDPDCVLFGNLETAIHGTRYAVFGVAMPGIFLSSAGSALLAGGFVIACHHRLITSSFDSSLATLVGQSPAKTQAILLGVTAAVVVVAFQSVGAILSLALLILPAATGLLICRRVPGLLVVVAVHGLLSAIGGLPLAAGLGINYGASVVIVGATLFAIVWVSTCFKQAKTQTS